MVKILILLLLYCGWANSCVHHKVNQTAENAIKWEICCIQSTTGIPYSCAVDQQSTTIDCGTDDQYVELICIKDTSNPCTATFDNDNLVIEYKSNIYYIAMHRYLFLMIQRNIVEKNQNFFNKDLNTMKKTIFTPVNINPVGNFWLGLDLIHYFTAIPGYETTLQIRVNHTVKNDRFAVGYASFKVGSEATSYDLLVSGFYAVNYDRADMDLHDAIMASSKDSAGAETFSNANRFYGSGDRCVDAQRGAWWMNAGCSRSNLNSDDGKYGWEYSGIDARMEITGSLMGISLNAIAAA